MPNIIFTHALRNTLLDLLEAISKDMGYKGKKFLEIQTALFQGAATAIDHVNGSENTCFPPDIYLDIFRGNKIARKPLGETLPSQDMHSFVPPMQVLDVLKVATFGLNSVGEETLKYLYNNHIAWHDENLSHIIAILQALKALDGLPESDSAIVIREEVTRLAQLAQANASAFVMLTSD